MVFSEAHSSFILIEKTQLTLKKPLQLNNTNKNAFIWYTFASHFS